MQKKGVAEDKAFEAEWVKLRAAKLQGAGFDPIFK